MRRDVACGAVVRVAVVAARALAIAETVDTRRARVAEVARRAAVRTARTAVHVVVAGRAGAVVAPLAGDAVIVGHAVEAHAVHAAVWAVLIGERVAAHAAAARAGRRVDPSRVRRRAVRRRWCVAGDSDARVAFAHAIDATERAELVVVRVRAHPVGAHAGRVVHAQVICIDAVLRGSRVATHADARVALARLAFTTVGTRDHHRRVAARALIARTHRVVRDQVIGIGALVRRRHVAHERAAHLLGAVIRRRTATRTRDQTCSCRNERPHREASLHHASAQRS